jgi:two-component system sensor kinase FixL
MKLAKKLHLKYLPKYAAFLLKDHVGDFVTELIRLSRAEDVPLLRYFSDMSDEKLVELGLESNKQMLTLLSGNKPTEFIEQSTKDFIANQLPIISREEIVVEDITLVSLVRRKVFRNLLSRFTTDTEVFGNIMEDVDRFVTASETAAFNAYNKVQQEHISKINAELKQHQEELLEAQDLAGMGSFFWDMKGINSIYTPGALKIFGLTGATNMNAFFECVHPGDREKLKAAIDKALLDDGLYECDYTYTKDGVEKRISSRGTVTFEDEKPVSMRGTVRDITKEYQLLQGMQASEQLHKQAQAITHIGNWTWDILTNKVTWSDEMYRIYGLEPQSEQITFERFMQLIHPDDREKRQLEIRESLETLQAKDYYLRVVNPDGKIKMLKGRGEIITGAANRPVMYNGTCQDVTTEYLLNKDLQEKEKNFQQLINNAPDGIIVIDKENIITLWNPKTEQIFGWKSEEVIGRSLSDTIIPPRLREAHEAGMRRYLQTGVTHILNTTLELVACNRKNEEFNISLTVSESMQGGDTAFVAFIRDISMQKNTQRELRTKTTLLELKNEELKQINKELESFNYAASHDLQEPLRKMQVHSSRILQTSKDLPPQVLSDFEKILKASARMQQLLEALLHFSQTTQRSQETEPVDLTLLIEEIKNNFITEIAEKDFTINMGNLPMIRVVRLQFLQVFLNLFTNAIKYHRAGVAPVIDVEYNQVYSNDLTINMPLSGQKFICITISDNGIGFQQEYSDKIFDLFARLHNRNEYAGTGIGLATCKKIIQNHNGIIKAGSIPGKGSVFSIYLPEDCVVTVV